MNKDTPIICFVGKQHDECFIAAVREIIQKSELPIVIVQTDEKVPEPIEFKIPDVKIEDIIKNTELILATKNKTKHKRNNIYTNKNNYKLYNNARDNRLKIRMQTYQRQRTK